MDFGAGSPANPQFPYQTDFFPLFWSQNPAGRTDTTRDIKFGQGIPENYFIKNPRIAGTLPGSVRQCPGKFLGRSAMFPRSQEVAIVDRSPVYHFHLLDPWKHGRSLWKQKSGPNPILGNN